MKPWPLPLKELLRRIEAKTEKTVSCWLWNGHMKTCHGRRGVPCLLVGKQRVMIRQVIEYSVRGPMPPKHRLVLQCGVERCIRWDHFKPMPKETCLRGHFANPFPAVIPGETVTMALHLFESGQSQRQVAGQLGLSVGGVHGYIRGISRRSETGMHLPLPVGYWRMRRTPRGEMVGTSKLSWQEVLIAVGLRQRGYQIRRIAEALGVSVNTMKHLLRGRSWGWLTRGLCPLIPVRKAAVEVSQETRLSDEALVFEHWKGGQSA